MPQLDSADLARTFLEIIPKSMRSIHSEMGKAQPKFNITQVRILADLSNHPTGHNELARSIGISMAAMSRTIQTMVTGGYIKETHARSDRKKILLQLTKKGEATFRSLERTVHLRLMQGLLKLNGKQKKQLVKGLTILDEIFGQDNPPQSGSL